MTPAEHIDELIAGLNDWRGKTLASVRKTILEADAEIAEEWKWMGSPVWSRHGNIVVGNAHKDKVKLTFSHGASLPDPDKLFNNGFGGKVWRAIDIFRGRHDRRALPQGAHPRCRRIQSCQIEEKAACGCARENPREQRGLSSLT